MNFIVAASAVTLFFFISIPLLNGRRVASPCTKRIMLTSIAFKPFEEDEKKKTVEKEKKVEILKVNFKKNLNHRVSIKKIYLPSPEAPGLKITLPEKIDIDFSKNLMNLSKRYNPDIPWNIEDVDQPPVAKPGNRQPNYPGIALRKEIEGLVKMKFLINENGKVDDIDILSTEGHDEFGDAVLMVAKSWRFSPAVHEGKVVKVWAYKTISFNLDE